MLFKFESTKNTCKFGQLKDRETKIIYQKKKKLYDDSMKWMLLS